MSSFWLITSVLLAIVTKTNCDLKPWSTENCPVVSKSCRLDNADEDKKAYLCDETGCHLRVAIILPNSTKYIVNAPQALLELQEVEDYARKNHLLPNRLNVTYRIFDDQCDQAHATIGTIDAYIQYYAHVIFGSICDYSLASSARIVKYLGSHGTPLITAGGFSFDFVAEKTSCDKEFYMLINAGIADYQSISEFFYLILAKYKWKQIALMYEKYDQNEVGGDQSCQLLMKTVMNVVKNQIPDVSYHDGDIWLQKITYEEYLTKTVGTQFGIVVMCMNHTNTRRVLIEADKLGMTDRGEYVFLNFDMYNNGSEPWFDPNDNDRNNEGAKRAYKSLLTFTPMIEAQNTQNDTNLNSSEAKRGASYLDGIYNGFLLYLLAIEKSLFVEDLPKLALRGVDAVSNMYGKRFQGKRGENVIINCNGQKVASYALLQMGDNNKLEIVANYTTLNKQMQFIRDIKWVGGKPPTDTPQCGYDDSKCAVNIQLWIIICILSLLFIVFGLGYRMYKKYQAELDLAADNWKIHSFELAQTPIPRISMKLPDVENNIGQFFIAQRTDNKDYEVAQFHLNDVIVKYFHPPAKIELDRAKRVQLKKMRDLSHPSLVKFYGACLEPETIRLVTEHCQRGSLLDVLKDEGIVLDEPFQLSLINDIVLGMHYLHSNDVCHGALKSTNCLIDGHFGVKLADFGLDFIRKHSKEPADEEEKYKKLLWTSPEVLRSKHHAPHETKKRGDVYSFGIILHEIIARRGTFHTRETYSAKEIVDKVKARPDKEPLRPHLGPEDKDNKLTDLMKECWAEDAEQRPDFGKLKNMIRELNRNNKGNLVDNLLNRMELYANNLESLVMDRTNDFLVEKKKCEDLLYQLLPKSVASQLISEQTVIAETFDQVTICFSDIVEFTKLSAASTPLEVVDLLNDLYTTFDEVIGDFNVYKVETIGDAYLVVSGLPERNENRHAAEIARMSLKLMETVKEFKIRHRPNDPLKLRIGMHTGSCVAGVVGLKMPRYCLFGDTVNTASRMESNGLPLKIHVSADTKKVLDESEPSGFQLECRGEIDIKGKGKMTTYWLIREVPRQSTAKGPSVRTNGTAPRPALTSTSKPLTTFESGNLVNLNLAKSPTSNGTRAESAPLPPLVSIKHPTEETVPLLMPVKPPI